MKALLSRPLLAAAADLAVMGFAALMVLLSGLAIVAVLPFLLFVAAIGPNGWLGGWWSGAWFAAAWCAAVYGAVAGVETVHRPSLSAAARLAGLYVVAVLACPLLRLP